MLLFASVSPEVSLVSACVSSVALLVALGSAVAFVGGAVVVLAVPPSPLVMLSTNVSVTLGCVVTAPVALSDGGAVAVVLVACGEVATGVVVLFPPTALPSV